MKIVNYRPEDYPALWEFVSRTWPERAQEYLKYRLEVLPRDSDEAAANLLVLDDCGQVVGCNLFFPSRAEIFGREETVFWSHDTMVDPRYRGDAGMELILRSNQTPGFFGAGLSETAQKIHRRLRTNFIAQSKGYYIFNIWSCKLPFYRLGWLKSDRTKTELPVIPDTVGACGMVFERVRRAEQLRIPEKGYWNKGQVDIDFVRDERFFRLRFFENVYPYAVFRLRAGQDDPGPDRCYFVVRRIDLKGFPALSLVDFRYDLDRPEQFAAILRAVAKIAFRNRLPLSVVRTTLPDKKYRLRPLTYRSERVSDVITRLKTEGAVRMLVTQADSDTDFIR